MANSLYRRRPRRPPFLLVLSVGIGVTSSILPIRIPALASALSADCAPGPGVFEPFPKTPRQLCEVGRGEGKRYLQLHES